MTDVFELAIRQPRVRVGADHLGSAVVDITSRLGRHEQVSLEVDARGDAENSWFAIDPDHASMQDGETTSTQIAITVPPGTPAGDYEFAVRASAVSDPQNDFTVSQVMTAQVPEPKSGGIPTWLLILLGVIVAALIAVVLIVVFSGDDDEPADEPQAPSAEPEPSVTPDVVVVTGIVPADLIGKSVSFVEPLLGDFEVTEFADPGAAEGNRCVMLHSPAPGQEATAIALLTRTCEEPSLRLEPRPGISARDACDISPSFCLEVDEFYGNRAEAINEEWQAAAAEMAEQYERMVTELAVETPNLISLSLGDAALGVRAAGSVPPNLVLADVYDVGEGASLDQCVLLQHPFPDQLVAVGGTVTALMTSCPDPAPSAGAVVLFSTLDMNFFENLSDAAPNFAAAIEADPGLDPDSIQTVQSLQTMVADFRAQFVQEALAATPVPTATSQRTIPNLIDVTVEEAQEKVEGLGFLFGVVFEGEPGESSGIGVIFFDSVAEAYAGTGLRICYQNIAPLTVLTDSSPAEVVFVAVPEQGQCARLDGDLTPRTQAECEALRPFSESGKVAKQKWADLLGAPRALVCEWF